MNRTPDGLKAPRPLVFDNTPALLLGPTGRIGVILVEDWGYEGLCARRSLRLLAETLATDGYPVLRYDLAGMGGTICAPEAVSGIDQLDRQLDEAVDAFRRHTGADKIVLAGLGLGSLLAVRRLARNRSHVGGLVLLAPLLSGRLYLREGQIRAAMISERTHVKPELPEGAASSVAGLVMSEGLARDLKGASFGEAAIARDLPVLCLPRPGRAAEEDFAGALAADYPSATSLPFAGYDDLVTDPTLAVAPLMEINATRDWLLRLLPPEALSADTASALPAAATARLDGDGFTEEVVTVGRHSTLVGTWCEPAGQPARGRTVLFLTAGGTPRNGWALSTRETARNLAREGIASLRLDLSDIGDSSAATSAPSPEHYSVRQLDDLTDALDFLTGRASGGVIATGACSGAYVALRGAVSDPRIQSVVCVNLQRFLWDPRENIGDLLRFDHGEATDYARKLLDKTRLRKLFRGEVPVLALIWFLVRRTLNRFERASAPYALGLTTSSRLRRAVLDDLATLERRGQTVDLVYSENDPGLPFLAQTLGPRGRDAGKHKGLSLTFLDATDHNLTPPGAREAVSQTLRHLALDGQVD